MCMCVCGYMWQWGGVWCLPQTFEAESEAHYLPRLACKLPGSTRFWPPTTGLQVSTAVTSFYVGARSELGPTCFHNKQSYHIILRNTDLAEETLELCSLYYCCCFCCCSILHQCHWQAFIWASNTLLTTVPTYTGKWTTISPAPVLLGNWKTVQQT